MTSLMDGDRALLCLCHHLRLLLQATDDTVYRIKEVLLADIRTVMTSGYQGSLVTYVGNISTRETGSLTCQEVDIQILVKFQGFQVYLEYLLTLIEVWQVDMYLTVETTSTHQGGVKHVGTVGGSKGDDTTVGTEAIHLCQQGVQRILTLVITSHGRILGAGSSDSIYLIDEDDTGSLRLCLLEQVTYTTGSHSHEHLHEVGTTHREERNTSLTGNSFGKQCLTCSRRTYQQCSLGDFST